MYKLLCSRRFPSVRPIGPPVPPIVWEHVRCRIESFHDHGDNELAAQAAVDNAWTVLVGGLEHDLVNLVHIDPAEESKYHGRADVPRVVPSTPAKVTGARHPRSTKEASWWHWVSDSLFKYLGLLEAGHWSKPSALAS